MSGGGARYALGVACVLAICFSLALAAVGVRRRYFGHWEGALARLVEALTGLGLLIGILEALGTVGLFGLVAIVCACVVVGLAVTAVTWGRPSGLRRALGRADPRIGATIALLGAAAVAAEWASPTLQAYDLGTHNFDSLWYHLPWAAGFAQTGHVTQLHYDVEYLLAFYPASGEMLHGLGIVLFAHDTLSPSVNLLWLGLALLAAWCIGQRRGLGAVSVWGVALILATPMMLFSQAGSGDDDILGVFFLLGAVALLLNGEEHRAAYVLAAISAGLAISVKLTFLVPVGALTAGVLALAPPGRWARSAGMWLGPLILGGGFWYARNLIAVGNPLPWTSFGLLPTPAPPLQQHTSFAIAHYVLSSRFWNTFFVPGTASQLGRWWYVLLAVAILGPLLCTLPGAGGMLRMLGIVALAGLVAYVLTPNSASGPPGDPIAFGFNLRFAAPALTLALAILPLAPPLAEAPRPLVPSLILLGLGGAFAATVAQANLWPSMHALAAVGFGLAVLAVGLIGVWAATAGRRRAAASSRVTTVPVRIGLAAGAAILLSAGAAAGYPWQKHYLRGRYAAKPVTSDLAPVWDFFRPVHGARIGVVGTYGEFLSYPLLGGDDSNRVQYVGRHGPHGSFVPITSCRGFRSAVNDGHFGYLVTTPTRNFWIPHRLFFSPEGGWIASDSAARPLLRYRAAGRLVSVFELTGQLHPGACP